MATEPKNLQPTDLHVKSEDTIKMPSTDSPAVEQSTVEVHQGIRPAIVTSHNIICHPLQKHFTMSWRILWKMNCYSYHRPVS